MWVICSSRAAAPSGAPDGMNWSRQGGGWSGGAARSSAKQHTGRNGSRQVASCSGNAPRRSAKQRAARRQTRRHCGSSQASSWGGGALASAVRAVPLICSDVKWATQQREAARRDGTAAVKQRQGPCTCNDKPCVAQEALVEVKEFVGRVAPRPHSSGAGLSVKACIRDKKWGMQAAGAVSPFDRSVGPHCSSQNPKP